MIRKLVVVLSICALLSLASLPTLAQSIPNWQPNTAYAVGALVMFNGVEYKCIQAHTSQVGWEPPNVPALWQPVTGGGGSGCSAAPGVPTGLTSSSTTSSATTLSWTAASAPSGCSVSSYTVFQNGSSIGTTGGTSFSVSGLAASTTFNFTVSAADSFGSSAQSSAVSVTTQASSGGGGGGSCGAAWNSTTIYSSPGNLVSRNGVNYTNNFWTQGDDPATHNGGPGSGQPWTAQGSCSACTTKPNAPGTPTASGTTFNSTNLSWPGVTAPANCSITGYTILKNGSSIGTTTGTSFSVSGLTAQSTFSFSVEANDGAGSSAPSSSVSVTTPACTGSCSNPSVTFAAYKDVTINADFNTGLQRTNVTGTVSPVTSVMPNSTLVWAFATGTCGSENWGGISPTLEAANIQAFVNAGKKYVISTGGANGTFDCPTTQGMINFINTYNSANLVGVDFDIEGGQSQQIIDNLINGTIAAQKQFPNLQFSFTIPSLGSQSANPITGGGIGTTVVSEIKRLGLTGNYFINLMTFDYGSTSTTNCVVVNGKCDMGQSAIAAAQALNQQQGISFKNIGLTQDIGQADTQDEVTTLQNISALNAFVLSNGLAASRFWSFDRDTPGSCAVGPPSSSTCNGTGDPALAFTKQFMSSLGVN